MRFANRQDAGRALAKALSEYAGRQNDVVVIGLPRGGVVVAAEVAFTLALPLDIIVPRKIGHAQDPEYAIGAVTEAGNSVFNEAERVFVNEAYLDQALVAEQAEARRRLSAYRAGRPPRNFSGKVLILVDDGIATGYTMRAALRSARVLGAAQTIVAVPHGAPDTLLALKRGCDEIVALSTPIPYLSVGTYYDDFPQITDEEVVALLRAATTHRFVD